MEVWQGDQNRMACLQACRLTVRHSAAYTPILIRESSTFFACLHPRKGICSAGLSERPVASRINEQAKNQSHTRRFPFLIGSAMEPKRRVQTVRQDNAQRLSPH
jgi:hypothetical protein